MRFLFGFQQLERIAVNQPIPYSLAQCGSQTIDEDAAGGTSKRLFPVVEGAGFQKGDEALAEILIDFRQGEVGLAYM